MLCSLLLFAVFAVSSPATADTTDSPFGPELSKYDVQKVMRQYKNEILKETTPADTIIFVGNSASYFYYLFNEADDRHCHIIPISNSRYSEKRLSNIKFRESNSTIEERTKGFCDSFIYPLQPFSPETTHEDPLRIPRNFLTRLHPTRRIILVDFSLSGASVNGFLRVIKSCVAKTYNPYTVDQNVNVSHPVVLLNILGEEHAEFKAQSWNHRYDFGLSVQKDLVVPGAEEEIVVTLMGLAEIGKVPRLLPSYPEDKWKVTKVESEKFLHDFQQDPKVQELISKLKEIGKN